MDDKEEQDKRTGRESQGRFIVDYSNIDLKELSHAVEIVNEVLVKEKS